MTNLAGRSIDAIITDPIYPEVDREYGGMTENHWHAMNAMMREFVAEAKRTLKLTGSMVVILQPSAEKVGKMRLWLRGFVAWARREWNLVQEPSRWAVDMLPLAGIWRGQGLIRLSTKWCVWLGRLDCYRKPGQRTADTLGSEFGPAPGGHPPSHGAEREDLGRFPC